MTTVTLVIVDALATNHVYVRDVPASGLAAVVMVLDMLPSWEREYVRAVQG